MASWNDLYEQKKTTPEEAVRLVKDGDWVDYGMTTSQPIVLIKRWQSARTSFTILKSVKPCRFFRVTLSIRIRTGRLLRP